MGLGRLLHDHAEQADAGGTIEHPRAYEMAVRIGFGGRRRRVFGRIAGLAGAGEGDHILDVGCGTGYLARILAPAVAPGGHVTGVDPAQPMIDYANRRAPSNCTFVTGEGQRLAFADGSFDLVVSSLAIHHIPLEGRAAALREMFRVLRPDGRLMIVEFRPPESRLGRHLIGSLTGPAMRHDLRAALAEMIADAGFRIEGAGNLRPLLHSMRAVTAP